MLSGLSELDFITAPDQKPAASIGTVGHGFEAFLVTGEAVDIGQLKARFKKELEKQAANAAKIEAKLKNENFVKNAPQDVIAGEKEKLAEAVRRIEKLNGYLRAIE